MDRRIKPQVPPMAKKMDKADSPFSAFPMFLASLPVCRSHLSAANERSRKMVVTDAPAMKSGWSS